jgi:mycothiol synthase
MMGLHRRPLAPDDAGDWTALLTAIHHADGDVEHSTEQEVRETFGHPDKDFAAGSIAIYHGPAMVGYGILTRRGAADPVHAMIHDGGVHPSYRGRGLGGELLDWAEQAAVPLHNRSFPGQPLELSSGCLSSNAAAVALHEQHGYTPARWFHSMLRELSAPVPDAVTPPGVRVTGYQPHMAEHARLIRNESFRDHWGSTETTPQTWAYFLAAAAFRPELSFLAYEQSEPLGMLISREHETREGRRDLHIALVGTRAAGRKRGIATALLLTAMAAARNRGYDQASLDVDSDSLTNAVRLYERVGFTVAQTWIAFRKQLT